MNDKIDNIEFDIFEAIENGKLGDIESKNTDDGVGIKGKLKEFAQKFREEVSELGFEKICAIAGVSPIITAVLKAAIKTGIKASPKLIDGIKKILDKVTGKNREGHLKTEQKIEEIGG